MDSQLLVLLDEARVSMSLAMVDPPLNKAGNLPDEVENWPLLDKPQNLQPLDLLLHFPQGKREVVMVGPGMRGR